MESSKTPASPEAQPLDFTFNLSTMDERAILSNDPVLLSLREFPAHPKQVIDLSMTASGRHF